MPNFAKCGNPQCYCYGLFQEVGTGECTDCGLPFGQRRIMFVVLLNGPEPKEFQIFDAITEDDATAKALTKLQAQGLDPNHYRLVSCLEIPHVH